MAKLFVSHSSRDKEFAKQLARDLRELGHDPWFDEWEIKVGDCIPSQIEHGISEAEYVVVVLSKHAVASGWVDKEWKTKYWDEIETKQTLVLPVLLENCDIPVLLKTKCYADFRRNYGIGLVKLVAAINPSIPADDRPLPIPSSNQSSKISGVLGKLQSRSASVAECMAEALEIARDAHDGLLERFCRNELSGWDEDKWGSYPEERPTYRLVEVFVSPFSRLNLQYFGWGENASAVFDYMRSDPHIFSDKKLLAEPLSAIERRASEPTDARRSVTHITQTWKDLLPEAEHPDAPAHVYARADIYVTVLEAIRGELTRRLLDLLP